MQKFLENGGLFEHFLSHIVAKLLCFFINTEGYTVFLNSALITTGFFDWLWWVNNEIIILQLEVFTPPNILLLEPWDFYFKKCNFTQCTKWHQLLMLFIGKCSLLSHFTIDPIKLVQQTRNIKPMLKIKTAGCSSACKIQNLCFRFFLELTFLLIYNKAKQ